MPREIVSLNLSSPFPYEVGATFLSTLAYPELADTKQRERYRQALCRRGIEKRADEDPDFTTEAQPIPPAIFLVDKATYRRYLKSGNKILNERLVTVNWIVMPHLKAVISGKLEKVEGYEATVENLSALAMDNLGWKGDSSSTLKSRVWRPSKPVAHAAAALLVWRQQTWEQELVPAFPDDKHDFFHLCLELPFVISEIVELSEEFRLRLPLVEKFTIKEEDTIQFIAI